MGQRVTVSVEETELAGDNGVVLGVVVTCDECGESVEVYGTSDASVRRGCVMLSEQCNSDNWYVYDEE
jgi:hypothetical protein